MVEKLFPDSAYFRSDLGEPDGGLHRFDLAEKGANAAKFVVAPVLKQAGGLWGHPPLTFVRQASPLIDLPSNPVDGRQHVVLLSPVAEPLRYYIEY